MAQAFKELEFEVEVCADIFSALEKVTGQRFDVILADLDQGPEAGFLLKTAHELNLNKCAFPFAVASGTAYSTPKEFGVELILAKPIIPDQIKYALLSCDGFLDCMRSWPGGNKPASQQEPPSAAQAVVPPARPAANAKDPFVRKLPLRGAGPSPNPKPSLGAARPASAAPPIASPWPAKPEILRSTPAAPTKSPAAQPKKQAGQTKTLWSTTLGVAFLALAYGASRPTPSGSLVASIASESRQALEQIFNRSEVGPSGVIGSSNIDESAEDDAENPAAAFPTARIRAVAPSTPRLVASHRASFRGQVASPVAEMNQPGTNPAPELLPVAARTVQIPDSIRLAQPEADAVHTAPGRMPSIMGQLEPIVLPEETAEQMLSQKVQPSYPEQALKVGLQGAVVLQAWIGADGNIRDLKLVHGSLLLGQAAYKAVRQWHYKPYLLNGKAVEAQTYVTVNFRLPQQSLLLPSTH